jgi:threonine dehydratase
VRPFSLVTLDEVRAAARVIEGVAVRTSLLPWTDGLWLKPESLQPVGAFKLRGALNAVANLPAPARAAGVITHSSGNHGRALAFAARRYGAPCVVVMPDVAPPVKVDAIRALGASVVLVPPAARLATTLALAEERGLAVVPPFDDPDVIAGQGTVGLEIVSDLPSVAAVLVPVGGGGLASGVATAVKALLPDVPVIGVEPALAADAAESLAVGRLVTWPVERTYRTAADGLRTHLSDLTFAHLQARLDGIVQVFEEEILGTVGALARTANLIAEPSGAVAPAGYLFRRDELRSRFGVADGPVVAVVSGGNLDPALLARLIAAPPLTPAPG